MASISKKTQLMPASAIRKLVPFADEAKSKGIKVFHLNVGAPGSWTLSRSKNIRK